MPWLYRNITTASTVPVSQGPADLIAVVVNTAAAASTVQIFDTNQSTTTNSTSVAKIDSSATGNFFYGVICRGGITAVMAGGNADVTLIFDQYGTEDVDQSAPPPPYGY